MYTPAHFAETDLAALDALVARDPFVSLVTVAGGAPQVSHLPVLYRRDGERVTLRGHWSRANPQARHDGDALVIVHGAHAYISPGWYADKASAARVPTWNYAVAHLHGRLATTTDETALAAIVADLSQREEGAVGSDWRYEHEVDALRRQLRGIVGFELAVERIELKFKLNQNHPPENVRRAADGLDRVGTPAAREIAALMRDRLARREHPTAETP